MAKPLDIWITPSGPNPWKVVIVLEELGTPYEIKSVRFQDVAQRPFLDLNPNGRAPVIVDPNNGFVLWESGAIIQYFIEQYNPERKLTYDSLKEKNLLNQWLYFQTSGQGPYFGQSGWFSNYHPEKIQSAIDRYSEHLKRVLRVLEGHLSGTAPARDGITGPREWLVGDKMTYADIAFVPWNHLAGSALPTGPDIDPLKEFPHVYAWHQRMTSRPSFQKVWKMRDEYMEEQNLGHLGLPVGKSYEEVMEEVAREKREKGT